MQQDSESTTWLLVLNSAVERVGKWQSLALATGCSALLSLALSQLLITLLGHGDRLVVGICTTGCALGLGGALAYVAIRALAQLNSSHPSMARHATLDPLTGLLNRRHFMTLVEREWALARRYDTDCALVLIEVDRFKRVTDCYGRGCGNMLLQRVAEASGETLRQADVLARFSGEEFILFLPHTDPLGALDVAERIRERVLGLDAGWNGLTVPVSVSLGVAALSRDHLNLEHLIQDAEAALSAAKAAGRNCVRAGEDFLAGRASVLKS